MLLGQRQCAYSLAYPVRQNCVVRQADIHPEDDSITGLGAGNIEKQHTCTHEHSKTGRTGKREMKRRRKHTILLPAQRHTVQLLMCRRSRSYPHKCIVTCLEYNPKQTLYSLLLHFDLVRTDRPTGATTVSFYSPGIIY